MTFGLLVTSLSLGFRHGIDWDHIAAISDLIGSAESRRRGLVLSLIYSFGHAAVVFALGTVAILSGAAIPEGVDNWMGRIVGVTLVGLGLWVVIELFRRGRSFRLRSRWMLILGGTFAGLRRVRTARAHRRITAEHEHPHTHEDDAHSARHAHDHAHDRSPRSPRPLVVAGGPTGRDAGPSTRHGHRHRHDLVLPDDPFARYGNGTAAGIGVLHGIGVESPTQIAVFVAATSVAGTGPGLMLLTAWIVGLIVANAVVAGLAAVGLLHAERSFPVYAAVALLTGLSSIVVGAILLAGSEVLPDLAW